MPPARQIGGLSALRRLAVGGALLWAFVAVGGTPPAASEDFGGTVMPFSANAFDGDAEKIAAQLRRIGARSGIRRFLLSGPGHSVRVRGMMDVAGYAALGRRIRQVKERVAADGIDVGYTMSPTLNCGVNHPWRAFVNIDGGVRKFTTCPGDEGFRADFAAKCAAVDGEARPFAHFMDDDFRYFGFGCFCADHLRRFADLTGTARDRPALVADLKRRDARGDELRRRWHDFQCADLRQLAEAASAAIARASPETRVGLCAPGGFPERETAAFARALAGRHRPAVRWYGAIYGNDCPIELADVLASAQWARENLPDDIECLYEADPCPHSRFYASAARMNALVSSTLAMGFAEPYYWGLSSREDALRTSPDYLDLHAREEGRFAAIRRAARTGRLVGVQACYDPRVTVARLGADKRRPFDTRGWFRTLNRLGVPVTTAEAAVKLFAGHHLAEALTDGEIRRALAGRVFLDGAAAEALTERGFADLIGVKATPRDKIDFFVEHAVGWGGEDVSFPCSYHQNYGLDRNAVSRLELAGAESVAAFSGGEAKQPSITWFENRLGGKVAVMAVNLAGCKSPNVFSFAKRDFLVRLFRRLGGEGAVPARVIDRANVTLLANEDTEHGRLLLHAVNLSCDPADTMAFEVAAPYAGGGVEVLDGATWRRGDVIWRDGALVVSAPVNVYGTLVLQLHKKGKTE